MMDPEFFNMMMTKALLDRDERIQEQEADTSQNQNEEQNSSEYLKCFVMNKKM